MFCSFYEYHCIDVFGFYAKASVEWTRTMGHKNIEFYYMDIYMNENNDLVGPINELPKIRGYKRGMYMNMQPKNNLIDQKLIDDFLVQISSF